MNKYNKLITRLPRLRSLRAKLLVSSFALIILPYTFVGAYQLSALSQFVIAQTVQAEESEMLQLRQNISGFFRAVLVISEDFYFDKRIWEYFTREYTNPSQSAKGFYEVIQPRMNLYKTLRSEVSAITIYTDKEDILKNGQEIAALTPGTPEWAIYRSALKNPYVCYWKAERDANGWPVISMYRILNLNNFFVGLLKINVREEALRNFLRERLNDSEYYIVAPENIIVSSTKEPFIGESDGKLTTLYRQNTTWEEQSERAATYETTFGGEQFLVTSAHFQTGRAENWTIIKTTPESKIMGTVRRTRNNQLLLFIATFGLAVCMNILLSNGFSKRVKQLSAKMLKVQEGDFSVSVNFRGHDELAALGESFNTMVCKLDELVRQVYQLRLQQKDLQLKTRDAEFTALQSQINPHFLFNTLEAILAGIQYDPDGASRVIQLLAKCFRRIIRGNDEFIPIREELSFIADYLDIQKFRMQSKLSCHMDVDENLLDIKIPVLLLQPLVENAIHHGVSMKKGPGTVTVSLSETAAGEIVITVEDDGMGMNADRLANIQRNLSGDSFSTTGEHIGIKNVYDRIKLCYGEEGAFEITSASGRGVRVRVTIAKNAVTGGDEN